MAEKKTENTRTETIEIEVPKGHKKSDIHILVDPEGLFERQVNGFMGFLRERTVVTIAVSFVIATQVQAVTTQFVTSFLDPLTQLLFGTELSKNYFTVTHNNEDIKFFWGAFVYQLISFFVIVITIYVLIRLLKLDKFEQKKEKKK